MVCPVSQDWRNEIHPKLHSNCRSSQQTRVPYLQVPGSSFTVFVRFPLWLLFNICSILLWAINSLIIILSNIHPTLFVKICCSFPGKKSNQNTLSFLYLNFDLCNEMVLYEKHWIVHLKGMIFVTYIES